MQLFTLSTEVKNYILYGGEELHFIYGKMLESLCMFICSLNVQCVIFNNHYDNFLAYTSQIWPVKGGIPNPMSLS